MSDHPDVSKLRTEYMRAGLSEGDVDVSPTKQLQKWLKDAVDAEVADPTAMTLATSTAGGVPTARIVLLKGIDDRGLTFFTNYESAKGRELSANPNVALVFFWAPLERQVRVTGVAARVSAAETEEYFHSRPRGSQLGAWASHQSDVISSRATIEQALVDVEKRFQGKSVDVPPFWGGYLVTPNAFEFWQGRESRLHDRIRFDKGPSGWERSRLSP